jgi:cell division protein FtsQ
MIRLGIFALSLMVFLYHAWQDLHPPIYVVLNHPHLDESALSHWLSKRSQSQQSTQTWFNNQPWVRKATINQADSSVLVVDVEERHPVAQWQHGGMVDDAGEIFFPLAKDYDATLSTIQVPAREVKKGVTFVNALSPTLKEIGALPLTIFKMEPEGDWVVKLASNRYLVFGTMDLTKRMQVANYVIKRLHDHHEPWGRIDLRYDNGFAISKNPLNEPFHWPMIQLLYG